MSEIAGGASRWQSELAGIEGSVVRSAEVGAVGSLLIVDIGERIEEVRERGSHRQTVVRGVWRLSVELAAWRLESATEAVIGCEDSRRAIVERIGVLDGRRVTGVEVSGPAMETVFDFDGIRLRLFPAHSALSSKADESGRVLWRLWRPHGDILSLTAGPVWVVTPPRERRVTRLGR